MGRYIVERQLGKGGFGAVYLVRDQRVKGNIFALKDVVDPDKKERENFTFEGEVLKRLDHPSLPRVYRTFDDAQHNRAYILMDYIEGTNLEDLRQRQPEKRFPLAQALHIMAPIVDALDFLHQQVPPIVHRDIKPANIIVPPSGSNAVLVDFGIAKEYFEDATTTAVRRCSPGYGAPEQYASGTNPQTDLYGLGATLYALLTGVVPIDALYRMTQMGSRRVDPLEPVTAFAPDIPPAVAAVLQRAMEINSNDRFANVKEFWQALKAESVVPITPVPDTQSGSAPVTPSVLEPVMSPAVLPATGLVAVGSPQTTATSGGVPAPSSSRRRGLLLLLSAVLVLFALAAGVLFETGIVPARGNSASVQPTNIVRATQPAIKPTATHVPPTATPSATTPPPQVAATPPPVATPSSPVSAPVVYPLLHQSYAGTINDKYTDPATTASLNLAQIQQNNGTINGHIAFGPGLVASDTFTGIVTSDNKIEFILASYNGLAPLLFDGQIQADGTLKGTYCSYRGDKQCDPNLGGWGDWQAVPPASTSGSSAAFPDWSALEHRASFLYK